MSALAKLADVKTLLDISASGHDTLLTQLLERASSVFEQLALAPDGGFRRTAGIVEYPRDPVGRSRDVRLLQRPIESVSEVMQRYVASTDAEFDAETALVENDEFVINANMGVLERVNSTWSMGARHLRVTYTAGWVDPSDGSPPAGSIQPPVDVQNAVLQQAIRMFQNKDTAGFRAIDFGQGGGSVSLAEAKPHPALIEAAMKWRRLI